MMTQVAYLKRFDDRRPQFGITHYEGTFVDTVGNDYTVEVWYDPIMGEASMSIRGVPSYIQLNNIRLLATVDRLQIMKKVEDISTEFAKLRRIIEAQKTAIVPYHLPYGELSPHDLLERGKQRTKLGAPRLSKPAVTPLTKRKRH